MLRETLVAKMPLNLSRKKIIKEEPTFTPSVARLVFPEVCRILFQVLAAPASLPQTAKSSDSSSFVLIHIYIYLCGYIDGERDRE